MSDARTGRARRRRRWIVAVLVGLAIVWIGFQALKLVFGVVEPTVDYRAAIAEAVGARQEIGDGPNGWSGHEVLQVVAS